MKLAIVGATGLVGKEILKVIQERRFFYSELILVASKKSKGKEIIVNNKKHIVIIIDELIEQNPELVPGNMSESAMLDSMFTSSMSIPKLNIPEIIINDAGLLIQRPRRSFPSL